MSTLTPKTFPHLHVSEVPKDPAVLFRKWLDEAKQENIPLPTVASLASASLPSGRVTNRMVNIKELNANGNFVIFSDFNCSRKGKDVKTNPQVALTFYWQQLDRSVRVEGILKLMTFEESAEYFNSRSRDFQASVLIGEQSLPVESRKLLTDKLNKLKNQKGDLKMPEYWCGAELVPNWIEFYQGSSDRISDRISYSLDGTWKVQRLSP